MKKHLLLCVGILLVCFFKPNISIANKAAAGELIYEWVSDSTYRFIFKLYTDCAGDSASLTTPLCLKNNCSSSIYSFTMSRWTGPLPGGSPHGGKIPIGCYQGKTACDSPGSTVQGFKKYWYTTTVTLPYKCNAWVASTCINYRNASNNIQNSTAQQMYLECGLNNSGSHQGISSPACTSDAVSYVKLGNPTFYYNYPIDPNGDSLTTEIVSTRTGVSTCTDTARDVVLTPMSPPLSIPDYPFKVSSPLIFYSAYSYFYYFPKQEGNNIVTVLIKKYRSGILLGWVMRDINIVVVPYTFSPNFISGLINLSGSIYSPYLTRYAACMNQAISFSIYCKSNIPGKKLLAYDNHQTYMPGAIVTYSSQLTDSIMCSVNWVPTLPTDTGFHSFSLIVKDTTCLPPGIVDYTTGGWTVYVWSPVKSRTDTTICSGGPVKLTTKGGGNYLWSILNGTLGSLSCTKCASPIANPIVTTSYAVISTADSICPSINKDTVTVTVDQTYPRTLGLGDTILCIGDKTQLNVSGGTGNFTWMVLPGGDTSSLSCTNCANPVSHPGISSRYLVYSNPNDCYFNNDTVSVIVRPMSTQIPSIRIEPNIKDTLNKEQWITFTAYVTDCNNYLLQWLKNGMEIPGEINKTWSTNSIQNNDIIACKLRCSMACPISSLTPASNQIQMIVRDDSVIKPTPNTPGFDIIPNPNTGKFTIDLRALSSTINLSISNTLGETLYTETCSGGKMHDISLNIPQGIYFLKVNDKVFKFVVQ
jgi:hypothetical protein